MITELLERIETAAAERSMEKQELAHLAGLHPNTLRYMRGAGGRARRPGDPEWNPLVSTVRKLEEVLLSRHHAGR